MSNVAYSIELKGLNLPSGAKERIDASLKATVMSELGKLDLADAVTLEPKVDRFTLPTGTMGFVIRNPFDIGFPLQAERSTTSPRPIGVYPTFPSLPPPLLDLAILEALYFRPDVRDAIISNSRIFMELMSHDERASRNFNDLVTKMGDEQIGEERWLVPVAVLVGAVVAGGVLGYYSRP